MQYTLDDIKDLFKVLDKYDESTTETNAAYCLKVLCAICLAKEDASLFEKLTDNKAPILMYEVLFKRKYDELPLLINTRYPITKIIVSWRLKRGI